MTLIKKKESRESFFNSIENQVYLKLGKKKKNFGNCVFSSIAKLKIHVFSKWTCSCSFVMHIRINLPRDTTTSIQESSESMEERLLSSGDAHTLIPFSNRADNEAQHAVAAHYNSTDVKTGVGAEAYGYVIIAVLVICRF